MITYQVFGFQIDPMKGLKKSDLYQARFLSFFFFSSGFLVK